MGESEQQEIVDMLRGYSPERAAQAIRRVLLLEHQRCEARAAESAPMRIPPIRVSAPEAIPGTPPPPADEPDAHHEHGAMNSRSPIEGDWIVLEVDDGGVSTLPR